MQSKSDQILGFILCLAILVPALYGWVKNIIDIVQWHESIGMLAVRIAGIFVGPLGAVLGYF